jgi:hypothetical protein
METNSPDDHNFEYICLYGYCPECNEPNTEHYWCQQCNAKRFQRDFPNWTSGNEYIDKFIQETQLNALNHKEVLEWIPYNGLASIKYLAKGGFSTVYKAIWLDGRIEKWNHNENGWTRDKYECYDDNGSKLKGNEVAIKNLDNSSNVNDDFLNEVNWFFFNLFLIHILFTINVPYSVVESAF